MQGIFCIFKHTNRLRNCKVLFFFDAKTKRIIIVNIRLNKVAEVTEQKAQKQPS